MKVSGSKSSTPKTHESDSKSDSSKKADSKSDSSKKVDSKSDSSKVDSGAGASSTEKAKRDSGATEAAKAKAKPEAQGTEQAGKGEADRAQAAAAAEQTRRDEEKKASERAALEAKSPTLQAINRGTSDYKANGVDNSAPVDLKGGAPAQSVEQQRADAEKRAQLNQALQQTEPGRAAAAQLQEHGVEPELAPGKESYWDGQRMVVGRDQSPEDAAESVIHETNHMVAEKTGTTPDPTKVSREEYVQGMLREEADGTAQALEARRELEARGAAPQGPAPELEKPYRDAYDSTLASQQAAGAGLEDAQAAARSAGRDAVLQAYQDGSAVTSVDGQSYRDYYSKAWDDVQANRTSATSVVRPAPDSNSTGTPRDRIALNDNVGYFVNGVGDSPEKQAANAAQLDAALKQDAANGIKDIRLTVEVDVQSQTNQLRRPGDGAVLTPADIAAAAQKAKDNGITLLVDLKPSTPSVAAMAGRDGEGAANYAQAAASVARELNSRDITANYELGNEPNTDSHWPDGGNRDPAKMDEHARQYMTYEKAAYDAVKQAQGLQRDASGKYPPVGENGSHVMMAGLSHVDTEYLDRLYKDGLANNTDVVNMHPYNAGNNSADFVANMERIRSTMLENGDNSHKLWLTELGSQYDAKSPDAQGKYIDAVTASMPNYVEKAFWFNKVDVGGSSSDAGAFGLTEYDGTPRPGWGSLGTRAAADNDPANIRQRPGAVDSALSSTYAHYAPVLGNATGDAQTDPENPNKITQQFENGSISYDASTGAYDINTRLGRPTGAHYNGEQGWTYQFENGSVTYNKETGAYTATPSTDTPQGGTFDPFADARANNPALGAARGAAFYEPNGNLKQVFENGYIVQGSGDPEVRLN